ncbi:hypothetical protein [Pararhodobacter aggregans]|uniref:hypothetical protein n=1 Tax=Pararhodobacter aggregans TaxID=404875 RepID=UPI003A8D6F5E
MAEKRVSVRLVAEGGGQFRAELEATGAAGDRSLSRAQESAQVFGTEMERLRQKHDPLYAASKRYEAQLEELNRAQTMGVAIAGGYEARLEQLNAEFARVTSSSQAAEAGTEDLAREMERLRQKHDPLYAASKRYETQLEELNRAQTLGIQIVGGYEARLEQLNAEYARMATATQVGVGQLGLMTRSTGGLSAALGRSAPVIQQASYQVQDFAVQVASGTDVSRAFAQQAPQLVSALGPVGSRFAAIAGLIGVAIAVGVPLIAMLAGTGEEAKSLDEQLEDLESAVDSYRSAVEAASAPTSELEERFGTATAAARELLLIEREIARVDALDRMRSTLAAIAEQYGTFQASTGDAEWISSPIEETFARVRETLTGLSREDVPEVVAALRRLSEASGPDEAVEASRALLELLTRTLGPFEEMSEEARTLYRNVRQAGEDATELQGAAEGAGGALAAAAADARRIAEALDRAVGSASDLAAQSVTDLQRAQINYVFRDDPVGRARALAAAEFDTRTAFDGAMPDGARRQMEQDREAALNNAEAIARLVEETREWRSQQRDADRAGRRDARAEDQFSREMAEQIEAAQLQLDLVGRSTEAIAELTARQELLNDARRRGLDLDRVVGENGETLIEQIDRQAAAMGRLALQTEQASERSSFFTDIQTDLKEGLLDAITEGESFEDTLGNVAKALERAAYQALLFGEGPLANLFGGGGKGGGGLLGSIFAGVFHSGGDVGGTSVTRQVSPLVFAGAERMHDGAIAGLLADEVPAILQKGERVLSRAELASFGTQSAPTSININIDGANGDQHVLDLVRQGVRQGLELYDRGLPDRVSQIQRNPRSR